MMTASTKKAKPKPKGLKYLWKEWILPTGIGLIAGYLILTYIFSFSHVPSSSMQPTIMNPCRIGVNHLAIEFGQPYEGEVVTFHPPDHPKIVYVKRIIGMPGDTIYIHGGKVYRNGKALVEPYIKAPTQGTWGPYHVPAKHYFMLGDNRNNSEDSRYWHTSHYVARNELLGKVEFQLFPDPHWIAHH